MHRWLSTDAYWAMGRTHDQVARAAAGSVNPAAYAGTALVERAVALLEGWGVRRSVLRTEDAPGLYARFGFEPDDKPDLWMLRRQG